MNILLSVSFCVFQFVIIGQLNILTGVPVGRKSSVCLICMKYRIIILIIIIKKLGEILLSYIANTSRTHSPSVYVVSITALHSW